MCRSVRVVDSTDMAPIASIRPTATSLEDAVEPFAAALLARDRAVALEVVDAIARAEGGHAVVDRVIAPAMRQIGDLWSCGDVDVATEHAATFIAREALASLRHRLHGRTWTNDAPRAVAFAPEGERHELPTAMVATTLESLGWQVLTIGCDLPTTSMSSMLRLFDAEVVCMSVTTLASADSAVDAVKAVRAAPGAAAELWVGGGALHDEEFRLRLEAAGATWVGASISDLSRRARASRATVSAAHA